MGDTGSVAAEDGGGDDGSQVRSHSGRMNSLGLMIIL